MNHQSNRLTHFDGLRGIAAFIVFFCHLLVAFYPATHTGAAEDAHTAMNIETWLRNSPINLLFNGKFAVCVFFAISGYVLSCHYFVTGDKKTVAASMIKRYPRLMILVWVSVLIAFVLLKTGLLNTASAAAVTHSFWLSELYNKPVSFSEMLKNIGYEQLLGENVPIPLNNVLWTIATELKGSLLVFTVLLLLPAGSWRYFIYLVLIVYFTQTHYALFIFGLMLADFSTTWKPAPSIPAWAWLPIIAAILVFGSYKLETSYVLWNWIGPAITFTNPLFIGTAALLFLACYHPGAQSFLNKKPHQWLGKISYSLYICHLIIMCLLICPLFYFLYMLTGHYHTAALLAITVAIPLTLSISLYLFDPIDRWSIKVSNRLGKRVKSMLDTGKEPANVAVNN